MKIVEWAVVSNDSPYTAPELRELKVSGLVYGSTKFPDGEFIVTSSVVEVNGRVVKTRSGSEYTLDGPPNKDYVDWCIANGVEPPTEETPIRVRL